MKYLKIFLLLIFAWLTIGAFAQKKSTTWLEVMKDVPTAKYMAFKLILTGNYDSSGQIINRKILDGKEAYVLVPSTSQNEALVVPTNDNTPFSCTFNGNIASTNKGWWIKILGMEAGKETAYKTLIMTKDSKGIFRIFELKPIFEELFK